MHRSSTSSSTRSTSFPVALIALALALTACSGDKSGTKATDKPGDKPAAAVAEPKKPQWPDVLAKVGDHSITRDDLLDFMLTGAAEQAKAQPYEVVTRSVEQMIAERLVTAAAAKEQKTPQVWLQAQVEQRIVEPSRAQIEATYQQYKDQMQGQSMEQAAPSIVRFLKNQQGQAIYKKVIDELRAQTTVTMLVQPPRIDVAEGGLPPRGPKSAPVTVIEFSDYECPFCGRAESVLAQVRQVYGDSVRMVFRDYPLPSHANAQKAAEAAGCADEQGKFWEMHGKLFANQRALELASLKQYAGELGLDQKKFDECLDTGKREAAIKQDIADGAAAGVSGTPGIFINGRFVNGALPFDALAKLIDEELVAKNLPVPVKSKPADAVSPAGSPAPGTL